jgi:hypothetical protein
MPSSAARVTAAATRKLLPPGVDACDAQEESGCGDMVAVRDVKCAEDEDADDDENDNADEATAAEEVGASDTAGKWCADTEPTENEGGSANASNEADRAKVGATGRV